MDNNSSNDTNNPTKDKIQSLLGFAVRANKLIYGADSIVSCPKKMHLIIVCPTLAQNSLKNIKLKANERNIQILQPQIQLEEILHKTNCKVVALKDKQMSNAIILNINENYTLI